MTKRRPHLRRSLRPAYRTNQSWTHLLFFVFLLVMLLLFYSEVGRGAAGCFGAVADPDISLEVGPVDPEPEHHDTKPTRRGGSVGVEKRSNPH
jgi:hypothetical protein